MMSSLDEIKDIRAEAYERGHFVATQRAISRTELGLPLEYGSKRCDVVFPDGSRCQVRHDGHTTVTAYFDQAKTDG